MSTERAEKLLKDSANIQRRSRELRQSASELRSVSRQVVADSRILFTKLTETSSYQVS
jgi:hypothetical protein